VLFGLVGTDVTTGEYRMTMGLDVLFDGVGFVPLSMGLFGLAEIAVNLESTGATDLQAKAVTGLWPTLADLRQSFGAMVRGTAVGTVFGILPGGGPTIAAFSAYSLEKKVSRSPERFGKGAIEGVAAPESANNAAAQACFIPMLSLGIPPNALMALMIGAMMIHGITPGPEIISKQPALFWGLIASMWIGNLMLVILNLPLVGIFVNLLRIPYTWLVPIILIVSVIGVYSVNFSTLDIWVMVISGGAGYVLRKFGYEMAPLLLALVLGDRLEENFRLALTMSGGSYAVFADHVSLVVLASTLGLLLTIQALAWTFGYRKSFADETGG